jgi:FkbM family methyltransferase
MLKAFRQSVLKITRSFGYELVPLGEMKERDLALHLSELLARLEIDCVLDVGANVGQYRDFLRERVLYGGTIVSFEPVSRHVGLLSERAGADPGWHIEPYALGAQPDHMSIDVDKSSAASRIETVMVKTLDMVLPALARRLGFRRPYLKLDTQGFDIDVLKGAEDSLSGIPALQSETTSVFGIYKGMPSYMDTIHYLGERGFDITGLYPVSRDRSLRLIEFDCVMINRSMTAPSESRQSIRVPSGGSILR